MGIVAALKDSLDRYECENMGQFFEQIRDAEQFSKEMVEAGVEMRKKEFTIPLMDRIRSLPST